MGKYIIAAALIVAAAVLGYLYLVPQQATVQLPQPGAGNPVVGSLASDTDPYDVLVRFDGEAFEPKELTVTKGTRVRFLNESTQDVWPASAVHPTHSIYPESDQSNCLGSSFDACKPLAKDEFFDFTFTHEGEWRYHDHVRAFITGAVTVTP